MVRNRTRRFDVTSVKVGHHSRLQRHQRSGKSRKFFRKFFADDFGRRGGRGSSGSRKADSHRMVGGRNIVKVEPELEKVFLDTQISWHCLYGFFDSHVVSWTRTFRIKFVYCPCWMLDLEYIIFQNSSKFGYIQFVLVLSFLWVSLYVRSGLHSTLQCSVKNLLDSDFVRYGLAPQNWP